MDGGGAYASRMVAAHASARTREPRSHARGARGDERDAIARMGRPLDADAQIGDHDALGSFEDGDQGECREHDGVGHAEDDEEVPPRVDVHEATAGVMASAPSYLGRSRAARTRQTPPSRRHSACASTTSMRC